MASILKIMIHFVPEAPINDFTRRLINTAVGILFCDFPLAATVFKLYDTIQHNKVSVRYSRFYTYFMVDTLHLPIDPVVLF